jgi:histidyl-tRNA synthetase
MFQSIRGMQDSLPSITPYWEQLEEHLRRLAKTYAYQEIRFPIVEKTALFQHSLGTATDIVEKEMYHLAEDSKGHSLSLRPEGTASCVRAAIEHQLLVSNIPQRLWYLGPMFRRERPQKGRYRQFHQFGMEVFGINQPEIEVELIAMNQRLWKTLNIHHQVRLEINSLGDYATRQYYRTQLIDYFTQRFDELDEDSKRRLNTNPLRILDSKNHKMLAINEAAPKLLDYLDAASMAHFSTLQALLKTLNIPFTLNPHLVRGLDYYNKTVFEWVINDAQSAQNTVCAGGRYDRLVQQLGGPAKPGIGFSIGLERLLELWMTTHNRMPLPEAPQLYIIQAGALAATESLALAEKLRDTFPALKIQVDCMGGHFSQQFKRASEHRASIALVLGEDEIKTQTITLKHLQTQRPQCRMPWPSLIDYLKREITI